jgi:hypothetical protein
MYETQWLGPRIPSVSHVEHKFTLRYRYAYRDRGSSAR